MSRLRAPSIRRMFDGMANNIGPIALGVTFVAGLAWLAFGSCGCGGGVGPDVSAVEEPIAVPWCAALEQVQVSCAVDPLVACEERNGRQPGAAHACGTYASTSCVGFDSGCAGVIVYCCD
jgi:hypothetical protein